MALLYYSRIRFILRLMPLLHASVQPSAHVVSVFAGGAEGKIGSGPLPIGTPPPNDYGIGSVRKYTTYMKTMMFEALAKQHAGKLSLSHIFPGLVLGPGFRNDDHPTWFKVVFWFFAPLLRTFFAVPEKECGQRMLYLATERYPAKGSTVTDAITSSDGVQGGGAYSLHWDNESTAPKIAELYDPLRKDGFEEKVWKHTMDTFDRIEKENSK